MVSVHKNHSAPATCPVHGVKLWFPLAAADQMTLFIKLIAFTGWETMQITQWDMPSQSSIASSLSQGFCVCIKSRC